MFFLDAATGRTYHYLTLIAAPRRHLPVLTNSSLTTFRRCPREYYFKYVLNRKARRRSAALKFGSLFHRGLNAWWSATMFGAEYNQHVTAIDAMRAPHSDDEAPDPYELMKAEVLMTGYTARWGDEPYEAIAVEKRFAIPYGDQWEVAGSIDAIVKRCNGPSEKLHPSTFHNVEHKTTSADISTGSEYWRHVVALDSQVSTYDVASRSMGYDIRSTIYDAIRKPELIPLRATPEESKRYTRPTAKEPIPRLYANQREHDETPEEYRERLTADIIARPDWYFGRLEIVRLDNDNDEHARDTAQTAHMILFAEDHDAWPRSSGSCKRYGSWCDFFPVCGGETSIDDGTRFETKTKQHEELT